MTPQGQQVVVTQMPRPIMQGAGPSLPAATVIKAASPPLVQPTPVVTSTTPVPVPVQIKQEAKQPEFVKTPAGMKLIRDVTTPFVCEWGDCQM